MARNDSRRGNGSKQEEADRYRQAAEDALQQLDWTIGYLHGIRKQAISKALAKNRSYIRKQLMGQAEEPLPTQQTSEK
jgi:predicted HAD superfamily Cof-like phosphohydrolase